MTDDMRSNANAAIGESARTDSVVPWVADAGADTMAGRVAGVPSLFSR